MKKLSIFIIVVMLLPLLNFGEVRAATLYEYNTTYTEHAGAAYGDVWYGQSFTVGTVGSNEDHVITSVKLRLYRTGSPGNINVHIRATSSGLPTGETLCSGSFDGNSIIAQSFPGPGLWYEISLGDGALLSASTQYCILLECTGSEISADRVNWLMQSPGTSNGGTSLSSNDDDVTWGTGPATDQTFRVYGEPPIEDFTSATISYACGNIPSGFDMQFFRLNVQDVSGGVAGCTFTNIELNASGVSESLNNSWSASLPTHEEYSGHDTGWEIGNGFYFYALACVALGDDTYTFSCDIAKDGYNPTSAQVDFSVSGHSGNGGGEDTNATDPDFVLEGVYLTVRACQGGVFISSLPRWEVVVENQSGSEIDYVIDQEIYDPNGKKLECETVNDDLVNGNEKIHLFSLDPANPPWTANYSYPNGSYTVQAEVRVTGVGSLQGSCVMTYGAGEVPDEDYEVPEDGEDDGTGDGDQSVIDKAKDTWNRTKEFFSSGAGVFKDKATGIWNWGKDKVGKVPEKAKDALNYIKEKVPDSIKTIVDKVKDVVFDNPVSDWFGDKIGWIGQMLPIIVIIICVVIGIKVLS